MHTIVFRVDDKAVADAISDEAQRQGYASREAYLRALISQKSPLSSIAEKLENLDSKLDKVNARIDVEGKIIDMAAAGEWVPE